MRLDDVGCAFVRTYPWSHPVNPNYGIAVVEAALSAVPCDPLRTLLRRWAMRGLLEHQPANKANGR